MYEFNQGILLNMNLESLVIRAQGETKCCDFFFLFLFASWCCALMRAASQLFITNGASDGSSK